jgi:hypothetical protein
MPTRCSCARGHGEISLAREQKAASEKRLFSHPNDKQHRGSHKAEYENSIARIETHSYIIADYVYMNYEVRLSRANV